MVTDRRRVAGACFDELWAKPDRHANGSGAGNCNVDQTKPLYVRLNFRDGQVLAASVGQERKAQERIELAVERGKGFGHFHHTAYYIACAYALMNKPEPAIKWLEAAADDGFPCYPLFERDPSLNNLRQDARFLTFLAKQKQQWEYYKTIL